MAAQVGVRLFRIVMTVSLLAAMAIVAAPAQAEDGPAQRDDIFITQDSQFNPANGVRRGSGTASDPFVISGWNLGNLHISDTSKHVVIRDNVVTGFLTLNWNGAGITLVRNQIGDLRVNENVKRTGEATSGLIANNTFGVVGQLRHFDGVFENNVVTGTGDVFQQAFAPFDGRAVNFDGFNGSHFRNNEIWGYVEVRLHGHHHSSSYSDSSHYHGAAKEEDAHAGHDMDAMDHTDRWHQVYFHDNKIHADGPYALIYTDSAHSANDRTAASETNKELNEKHVHHTKVHMFDNTLDGAGLYVDIFNADDDRHIATKRGFMDIRNNKISLTRDVSVNEMPWSQVDGIVVNRVKDLTLKIAGNTIAAEAGENEDLLEQQTAADAGISLIDVKDSDIFIANNTVTNTFYGVAARQMTKNVTWTITGLDTQAVDYPVYYDNSVETHPRRRD